jgi:thioredoxin reductase
VSEDSTEFLSTEFLETDLVDVAVVGGGPAGLSAATWAGRYRRRVALIDDGGQRNRWTEATHGYLGHEGAAPSVLLNRAREDLRRYREVSVVAARVTAVTPRDGEFILDLNGRPLRALRLVLATGVRDVFPEIEGFEQFYGASVFTCPSCDGYEAQGKKVAVLGDQEQMAPFAVGLLDWASSVTLVTQRELVGDVDAIAPSVQLMVGTPRAFIGEGRWLQAVRLDDGRSIECDVAFCAMRHVQHSDLAARLGCQMSEDGCVVIDNDGRTSVANVFAAGDMTPGPHLVQVAAAQGAVAGITAAMSLRGHAGAPASPRPAPDPEQLAS